MKNYLFLLIFIVLPIKKSQAQLEVIDKIAEVLIPGITNGVKSILDNGGGKNKIKKEVKDFQNEMITKTQSVVNAIEEDGKNLMALNSLFKTTGGLFEDSASMKTLTNPLFIDAIISSNSQKLNVETAILFAMHWRQLEDKKTKLSTITSTATDNGITDNIAQYVNILDRNLINLSSVVKLTKDPKADMNFVDSKTYVNNIKRAKEHVDEINGAIRSINVQLSSRIGSLERSLKQGKDKIDKMTTETTN
ncbi:MAG: hypothetical protein K0U54_02685 [Bacteroidetes bacterium]|nr:hypothetical protein [Bacteroidota bacterium]